MEIFKTKQSLQDYLTDVRKHHKKIALVPTMGALHEGHLSLLAEAQQVADVVICSIFVNPTQFNDPKDLEKYPRPIEQDLALLADAGCDIVFLPTVAEMYPDKAESWHIDLGNLDKIWEGEKRPGHFQGVTQVVYKLFSLTQPDIACFGQKDFQQVMVIQHMVNLLEMPVHIQICPIIRSAEGLALSSRNMRLSEAGKTKALALSRALKHIKAGFGSTNLAILQQEAFAILEAEGEIRVEYLAICESSSLCEVAEIETGKQYVALLTAWVEEVRLLDNMILN